MKRLLESRLGRGAPFILLAVALSPGCPETLRPRPPIDPRVATALGRIDAGAIAAHVRFLAADELEGRGAGTAGYDRAARYVAERFAELGLPPASATEEYLQQVPLLRADLVGHDTSVKLRRGRSSRELASGVDILVSPEFARERADLTAPLAFVGFGVTAPEAGYDDYADVDVRGKVVVQFRGAPASLANDQRAYHASPWVKCQVAVGRGAIGLMTLSLPRDRRDLSWESRVARAGAGAMRWLEAGGNPVDVFAELFVQGEFSESGAAVLFEGAAKSLQEAIKAAEASRPQAFALPGEIVVATASRHTPTRSANVLARLPGLDPDLSDEHIVLTAHLDHLGIGAEIEGDAIYNGAYDNASGVAVLLEIARVLADMPKAPRRSVVFAVVTAEERGLVGSDYLAHHLEDAVGPVVANLNMDMVMMQNPLQQVIGFGAGRSTLGDAAGLATAQLGLELQPDPFPDQFVFIRSDHYSFVRQGIPALMLAPAPGPGFERYMTSVYHTPADDLSQPMDFDAGADFARLVALVALNVANADTRPSWNPGDFFAEKFTAD